jgi:hypothetical protein
MQSRNAGDVTHWCVLEVELNHHRFWMWGKVDQGPGFDDVYFTEEDGLTVPDVDDTPTINRHLFTVAVFATGVSPARNS